MDTQPAIDKRASAIELWRQVREGPRISLDDYERIAALADQIDPCALSADEASHFGTLLGSIRDAARGALWDPWVRERASAVTARLTDVVNRTYDRSLHGPEQPRTAQATAARLERVLSNPPAAKPGAAGLGARLWQARVDSGLTQAELADKAGLAQRALSNYERGLTHPDAPTIERLAKALEIDPAWLAGWKE